MTSIAIIGPGAIGGTAAAWLAQDPANQVSICARSGFGRLDIDTPQGALSITPRIFTAPDEVTEVDWVLIATKAYDVKSTVQWLPKLMGASTRVAILQNGVEHIERFAPYVAPGLLVPVVVYLSAERKGPGNIWQRDQGYFVVPDDDNGRDFAQLFVNTALTVTPAVDFLTQAWRKLALNTTAAVSALLLRPVDIRDNEELAALMRQLIRECILVARAEGAVLEDELVEDILTRYRSSPANSINSMHADRLAGRPLEIDIRNGAVVRIGQRHGIATPMNRLMVTLLKAAVAP